MSPHAQSPTRTRPARPARSAATGGAALAVGAVLAVMTAGPASANDNDWYRLRMCESGNNYAINTGNGYYGAYQFDLGTWRGVGGAGYPNHASAAEQDYRARLLYRSRGWSPWTCARILNLQPDPSNGYLAPPKPTAPAPTIATQPWAYAASIITLHGVAAPGAAVAVHLRSGARAAFIGKVVKAGSGGRWSYRIGFEDPTHYWATASGRTSRTVTTNRFYHTSIAGPATARLGGRYTVTGTTRPDRAVWFYSKPLAGSTFTRNTSVRADARGHFVFRRYLTKDTTYVAKGDESSAHRAIRTQVTSAAPAHVVKAGSGATATTVSGTAQPGSTVVVLTKPYGGAYSATGRVTASAGGGYSIRISGRSDTAYFARSSNGTASPSKWVQIRG